ncbi:MAG TPA: gliding motility-associated C-terminal domain-containing protein [Saprospiraceae bacterium]|nr:gliding motility-associated C-terminal domain-containing protein [Saprospiraceae bacterium]
MNGQPPICGGSPTMQPTCRQGCIICDIDGFKGRNTSAVSGELPADFCTTVKHNGQWIAFQAGSVDLTIDFTVTNCESGRGLEMGLYEGRNCENYQRISMCDTDVRPNTTVSFTNTRPLTVGQYYWLVIDGNGGDKCDYTLKVTKGTTKIPLITDSGILQFDNLTCQGKATTLAVIPPLGATEFDWSIDNVKIPKNNKTIQHVFGNEGEYTVCVEVYNVCSRGPKTCQKIIVTPPTPIEDTISICPNSTLTIQKKEYGVGTHLILFRDSIQCDSLVNLTIRFLHVEEPQIYLEDSLDVVLGENKQINARVNYDKLKAIRWSPSDDLSCVDCLNPILKTYHQRKLFLEVWTDDDCYTLDSLSYLLRIDLSYWAPNIIKQNSQENGIFKINTSGSIKNVVDIRFFDRWGNLVFLSEGHNPRTDFNCLDRPCSEGIYTWIATLLLFDDSTINIKGSLMVLE